MWNLSEVGFIGLPTELVRVAGKHAFRTYSLECKSESTDAAEQVNKANWIVQRFSVDTIRLRMILSDSF